LLVQRARMLADAREHGALVFIVYALTRGSGGQIATAYWAGLAASAAEALDLAQASGSRR
jgi:hypothetical protein